MSSKRYLLFNDPEAPKPLINDETRSLIALDEQNRTFRVSLEKDDEGMDYKNGHIYIQPYLYVKEEVERDMEKFNPLRHLPIVAVGVDKDDHVTFKINRGAKKFALLEHQYDYLFKPEYIMMDDTVYHGTYKQSIITYEEEKIRTYDGMLEPVNYDRLRKMIQGYMPELLTPTHMSVGDLTMLPMGKVYEEPNGCHAIIFATREQIMNTDDDIISGKLPFFYDTTGADKWYRKNIFGICAIDLKGNRIKLYPPEVLDKAKKYRDSEKEKELSKKKDIER